MQTELTITRSKDGAHIEDMASHLYANVTHGPRMDGTVGLRWEGTYYPSDEAEQAKVAAVVTQVIADGAARSMSFGSDATDEPEVRTYPRDAAKAREWDDLYNEGEQDGGYNPYR